RQERENQSSMIAMAKTAINEDRIQPYYQPKVRLSDGSVMGFEALLRWDHPKKGLQYPTAIEAAFHDRDVGWQISQVMLQSVTRDIGAWLEKDIRFGHIALSVAPADLLRPDYADIILERLHETGLPPSSLQLEVTENVFLGRRAEDVARTLDMLDGAGIRIALDDFGTGYASLAHLQRFSVHKMKIDGSLFDPAMTQQYSRIATDLCALAKSLTMTSIAEGVEMTEQDMHFKVAGCDVAKGFLFAPTVPSA